MSCDESVERLDASHFFLKDDDGPQLRQDRARHKRIPRSPLRRLWKRVRPLLYTITTLIHRPISLNPLTSDHGEDPCPKALLPVANKPLLEYTLEWLEQSGIRGYSVRLCPQPLAKQSIDVLLICPSRHRSLIHHHIHSDVSSAALKIDLQTYDDVLDSHIGTCDLLRQFSSRIKEDFVVVPCDFIPSPSLRLSDLLNKFRIDAVSEGSLATTCWFASQPPEKGTFVEEWGIAPTSRPIEIGRAHV